MMKTNPVEHAMVAIRAFLRARPDSADTVTGIQRWWISWPGFAGSADDTQTALERLETLGEVERFKIGSSIIWRRKK